MRVTTAKDGAWAWLAFLCGLSFSRHRTWGELAQQERKDRDCSDDGRAARRVCPPCRVCFPPVPQIIATGLRPGAGAEAPDLSTYSEALHSRDPVERLVRDTVLSEKEAQLGRMFLYMTHGA